MIHTTHIDQLPASRREAVWRDAVCNAFVRLECRHNRAAPLHGSLHAAQIGELRVTRVISSPQRVDRLRPSSTGPDEPFVLMSLQLNGQTLVRQDDGEAVLTPGSLAFYDTTRAYSLVLPQDFEQIVLQLPRQALDQRGILGSVRMATRVAAHHPYAQALAALGPQLINLSATGSDAQAERAASVASGLVALALEAAGAPERKACLLADPGTEVPSRVADAIVWRARDQIARHLADPALDAGRLAVRCGVSLRRLQEVFQAQGTTVSECLWHMRLEHARAQLAAPGSARIGVGEIGLRSGFTDVAHFSRRFRQRFGVSPSEYRASKR